MDALDHQHLIVVQLESATALLAASRLEVVARQFHLLAPEEGVHLLVEQRQVQGVQVFVVVVALLVAGRLVAVDEIIIQRDGYRFDAVDGQLYRQSLAGGRLAAAAGTGNENQADAPALGYLVGDTGNLLLLQGLADLYELGREPLVDDLVQVADGTQSEDVLPAVVLLEDAEHLVLMHHLAQLPGMDGRGDAQQQTVVVLLQSEEVELRGVGQQRTVIIVDVTVDFVIGGIDATRALQQLHL